MRGELLEAERVHSIVAGFFTVFNYFGGGGMGKLVARQRLDMVVDDRAIVESKATDQLPACAKAQLIGYLRATKFQVGVLLHFGPHPEFYRFVDTRKQRQVNPDPIR